MIDEQLPNENPNAHFEGEQSPVIGEGQSEALESAENLGETAMSGFDPNGEGASDQPQDDFRRYTPDTLYSEHKKKAYKLDAAQEEHNDSSERFQRVDNFLEKTLDRSSYNYFKKEAAENKKRLDKAKTDYDGNLAEAKHHIEAIQGQANEFVEAYGNYGHIQSILSEATDAPVVQVRDISEFIDKYGNQPGSIEAAGVYGALIDFFAPEPPKGTDFIANQHVSGRDRLPRHDIGETAASILNENNDGNQPLLKITETYTPTLREGYYTYETVKGPPEQRERYIRLTPDMQEMFSIVPPEDLDFTSKLYSYNGSSSKTAAVIGAHFELTDTDSLRATSETDEKTPFKAEIKYQTGGAFEEKVWQVAELGAENKEELRERVLTHLLDNMDLPAHISINGKPTEIKKFLLGDKEEAA